VYAAPRLRDPLDDVRSMSKADVERLYHQYGDAATGMIADAARTQLANIRLTVDARRPRLELRHDEPREGFRHTSLGAALRRERRDVALRSLERAGASHEESRALLIWYRSMHGVDAPLDHDGIAPDVYPPDDRCKPLLAHWRTLNEKPAKKRGGKTKA
jgi:hypothetical protein